MNNPKFDAWGEQRLAIIGMVHLPPLPGAPGYRRDWSDIRRRAIADARALVAGGVHGLMIENFGDAPFYPGRVPAHVVAHVTAIAADVRAVSDLPLGVQILRNDAVSAIGAAHAAGADFVRVNVLCGARLTDQGVISGVAHELLRERAMLGAERIRIFADVNVKHSTPLGPPRPIADEVADMVKRGGADAIIVSGTATGAAADISEARDVREAVNRISQPRALVVIGSGVTTGNVRELSDVADAAIVGTSLKVDGVSTNPVDPARVAALIAAIA
ncbi:MAG: BtpA/SgcQ family protein [Phycisphaerales bacterium]|nr:BtpA/SgcQ family protein [Phycisphaerales bacterium]